MLFGLTNHHQAWVTVIPDLSDWMGDVAPSGSDTANKNFSTFILPGAHDAGMNTAYGVNAITSSSMLSTAINLLARFFLYIPGIAGVLERKAREVMLALAMTQKDTFSSMLNNGVRCDVFIYLRNAIPPISCFVRYFDFRPAYLHPDIRPLASDPDTLVF